MARMGVEKHCFESEDKLVSLSKVHCWAVALEAVPPRVLAEVWLR